MAEKTLRKPELLRGKKTIAKLFNEGSSFFLYPYKVVFALNPEPGTPHRILVTVPKKRFKKAVDRNKIKRRIKESYRLNKQLLHTEKPLIFAYIYLADKILSFQEIEDKLKQSLLRLNKS